MIHLRAVALKKQRLPTTDQFPFHLPIVQALDRIEFTTPVTFLVGENGSGKSTLLEALACAVGSITVGSESVQTDKTLQHVRELAKYLRLTWEKRTTKGFFLRAEDFFGFAKRMAQLRAEMENELQAVDEAYRGRSQTAVNHAKMPYARELHAIRQRYGEGLDSHSHGESFLQLFQARFVPGGFYILDEPEAPLSPLRQLGLIALLKEMVERDAQFVIATHSPILMAFPGATILNLDTVPIRPVAWEDLEHVSLTRDFLNNPGRYLKHL